MNFEIFFVDTFTKIPFRGNPAAVCITEKAIPTEIMQKIAMEINLSETAFVHCLNKNDNFFSLRWFTPTTEVDLCGHATLATAHILYSQSYATNNRLKFLAINHNILYAKKSKDYIILDFPVDQLVDVDIDTKTKLLSVLELNCECDIFRGNSTKQIIIDVKDEKILLDINPCYDNLLKLNGTFTGVAITSRSKSYDFISRFFDPWEGINEDPVTGSAHTLLAPYWSKKLGKKNLFAKQESPRGGELVVQLDGNRVYISGSAVTVLCGTMKI